MKVRNVAIIGATLAALVAISGGISTFNGTGLLELPALAGENKTSLIDKDFEVALKKHFEKRFFDRINATDEQREKISNLLTSRMDETRPLRESMRLEGQQFVKLLAADTSDTVITEKAHSLREQRDKLMEARLDTLLKVRTLLTPEQRQQICARLSSFISGEVSPRAFLKDEHS